MPVQWVASRSRWAAGETMFHLPSRPSCGSTVTTARAARGPASRARPSSPSPSSAAGARTAPISGSSCRRASRTEGTTDGSARCPGVRASAPARWRGRSGVRIARSRLGSSTPPPSRRRDSKREGGRSKREGGNRRHGHEDRCSMHAPLTSPGDRVRARARGRRGGSAQHAPRAEVEVRSVRAVTTSTTKQKKSASPPPRPGACCEGRVAGYPAGPEA